VVVVGDVGLEVPRAAYYDKELELRLSRSYGPGRYDAEYEERGLDYPVGYVRWTERRNLRSFVELVASGRIDVSGLITARYAVDDAEAAYEELMSADVSPLAIVITYGPTELAPAEPAPARTWKPAGATPSLGLIGAGSFAQGTVAPGLRRAGFGIAAVASASGRSAHALKQQLGIERQLTPDEILGDSSIDAVAIVTRHATHAGYAVEALRSGKAVFVEKPACLTWEELRALREQAAAGPPLLVGFNRRHAPLALAMREHVSVPGRPVELLCRINAGPLPAGHWLNDPDVGGGRLVGEGCHFIDFAAWFVGSVPRRVSTVMRASPGEPLASAQSFSVTLDFPDDSIATIMYGSSGSAGLGKEYFEAHSGGRSAALDEFTRLVTFDGRRSRTRRERRRDKGHSRQFRHFLELVTGRAEAAAPATIDTMPAVLAALDSAHSGCAISPDST
jgi:predicted dehydrogenase